MIGRTAHKFRDGIKIISSCCHLSPLVVRRIIGRKSRMIECDHEPLRRAPVDSDTFVPTPQNQPCCGLDLMEYVAKVAGVIPDTTPNTYIRLHIILEDGVDIWFLVVPCSNDGQGFSGGDKLIRLLEVLFP